MVNSKKRPIMFSGEMVRRILDGSKTQTRRAVTPQPRGIVYADRTPPRVELVSGGCGTGWADLQCPFGQPGNRLWVRETWAPTGAGAACYRADCPLEDGLLRSGVDLSRHPAHRWRPSIHMPRWASRLALEVTGVRVERLQDISEEDARAEGFSPGTEELLGGAVASMSAADYFRTTWWDLYGFESWDANPWVWVVEFRREKKEV